LLDGLFPALIVIFYGVPIPTEVAILQDVVDSAFDIRDKVEGLGVEGGTCILLEYLTPELDLISVDSVHS
jgi:hypothetical protein